MDGQVFVGGGGEAYGVKQGLLLKYANRHGLIAGATGTGKTVTLQILAEGFSAAGVPVFLSDVKGDLSGLAVAGSAELQAARGLHEARRPHRLRRLRLRRLPGDLLGSVRRTGPPDPHHRGRDGPVADRPPAGAHRRPGRRAQHRLPGRRRAGLAAARPRGSAGAAGLGRRERRRPRPRIRQCRRRLGRRDPARAAGAREPGRRALVRRTGAGACRSDGAPPPRGAAGSRSSPPTS